MPGEALRLGPFTGGINQLSDPTALQDTELVDVINMELDLDGSYISRPPLFDLAEPSSGTGMKLLGWYITDAHTRLIGQNSTSVWSYESGAWTAIVGTGTLKCTAMVQYDNIAYLIATPDSATDGGSINDSLGFSAIAAIPRGGSAVVHKERLFIVPGSLKTGSDASLLKGSAPANFSSFPISVYINKGDGQKLIDILVYNDNLLLFKNDSTYVLAYDSDPADAITRKINSSIGVASYGCVVPYENNLYVLHRNNVYEVVNYDFAKINSKVPFVFDATKPNPWVNETYVGIIGDRLIVKYFARIYVFGLKSKVWTRWDTGSRYIGIPVANPIRGEVNAVPEYTIASANSGSDAVYSMRDVFDSAHSETITMFIQTKNYDYGVPQKYKRLLWWGADVSTVKTVYGTVQAIIVNFGVTWDEASDYTWNQVANNTWGQPLAAPVIVQTTVNAQPAPRKFVKFPKSMRFRQINFQLTLSYDGTNATGPVRVFTLTTIVGTKQDVSKSLT